MPHKTEKDLAALIAKLGIRPEEAVSVGNSLRSDVNPALAIGMNAIWIDQHVWEYERSEIAPGLGRLLEATDLTQVPELVEDLLSSTLAS